MTADFTGEAMVQSKPLGPAPIPNQMPGDEKWQKHDSNIKNSDSARPDLEMGIDNDTTASEEQRSYLVEFEGPKDLDNPKNWSEKRRWAITISMGLFVFTVTFASSIFSVNIGVVQQTFHTDKVTATLGVALFVLVGRSCS